MKLTALEIYEDYNSLRLRKFTQVAAYNELHQRYHWKSVQEIVDIIQRQKIKKENQNEKLFIGFD